MALTLTQDEILTRFREAHGDLYDYSKMVYVHANEKVIVGCRIHGDFLAIPRTHWGGARCVYCSRTTITQELFISEAKVKYGDRYTYEKTKYTGSLNRVIITCIDHGDFTTIAANFVKPTSYGCVVCANIERRLTTADIVRRCVDHHQNTDLDYRESTYVEMHTKMKIICLKHGPFYMTPANHLSGHSCSSCWQNKSSKPERAWVEALTASTGWASTSPANLGGVKTVVDSVFKVDGLDKPVCVEYDGNYWHSRENSASRDNHKSTQIHEAGYHLLRLRASGQYTMPTLEPEINCIDIPEYPTEETVSLVLERINSLNVY